MTDSPRSVRTGSLGARVRAQLSTLIVFAVLIGFAIWGSLNEWRIPGFGNRSTESTASNSDDESLVPSTKVIAPKSSDKSCPLAGTRLEFDSAGSLERGGIRLQPAEQKPLKATIAAPAEVNYDPKKVARLASAAPGRVWRLEKDVGARVKKGDVLALIDAARVGETKAAFLQSLTDLNLKMKTAESLRVAGEGIAQQRLREAEAALRDAKIRLFNSEQALINLGLPVSGDEMANLPEEQLASRMRFLGISEAITATFDPDIATSNLLPIKAPFDGIIAEWQVAPGEIVDSAKVLCVVADLTRIWLIVSVRQEDIDEVKIDAPIAFEPDGHPGELVPGTVAWLSTMVDERTRSVNVRATVDNPQGHLPARTFGIAHITVRDASAAVIIPGVAVQRENLCRFVFVQKDDRTLEVRPVRVGVQSAGTIEIREGLQAGEVIATDGSFFLKSEILKDRLGED